MIIIIKVLGKLVVRMQYEATGTNIVVDIAISDVELGTVIILVWFDDTCTKHVASNV